MSSKRNFTEAETLEQYRVSFENVEKQTEIATIMAEFGYDETLLTEGKTLLTTKREAFDTNKKEGDERSTAYSNFMTLKDNLSKIYGMNRKKGKVVFRKDDTLLKNLGLKGSIPTSYINWLENVKKYYSVVIGNTAYETKLARLKVTTTELQETVRKNS
jgi:hypothetical protein